VSAECWQKTREILEFLVLSLTRSFGGEGKATENKECLKLGYEVGSGWRKRLAVICWALGLSTHLGR